MHRRSSETVEMWKKELRGILDIVKAPKEPQSNSRNIWTIWKQALGSFSDEKTANNDDIICIVRTFLVGINILTCVAIISNVVHNW
jgi:hypothetical protein